MPPRFRAETDRAKPAAILADTGETLTYGATDSPDIRRIPAGLRWAILAISMKMAICCSLTGRAS